MTREEYQQYQDMAEAEDVGNIVEALEEFLDTDTTPQETRNDDDA